jgi:hypothetical protein
MPTYSPSGFEQGVAAFFGTYNAGKEQQRQQQEQALRKRQADTADQEAQVRLNEAGYDRITMPTIQAPPDQSFASRVGNFLHGGPAEPGSIVMKTHPSVRETEIAGARQAHLTDVAASDQHDLMMEALRAADARKLEADRNAGADRRNNADNATRVQTTGMEVAPRIRAQAADEKAIFAHDAVWAAQGSGVDAIKAVMADPRQMARAKTLGITPIDYAKAQQDFGDRFTAKSKGEGGGTMLPHDLNGAPITAPGGGSQRPLTSAEKGQAQRDPAYAAQLSGAGYKKGVDF